MAIGRTTWCGYDFSSESFDSMLEIAAAIQDTEGMSVYAGGGDRTRTGDYSQGILSPLPTVYAKGPQRRQGILLHHLVPTTFHTVPGFLLARAKYRQSGRGGRDYRKHAARWR